ncbi:aquaglyceroporin like protein [Exophiala viscosa]|uniref:Aquaglyceroporin like protein n=1 Tax=Exophiala viscosa TaxID=2486360 RepID=A0AAN6E1W5_9EURO|nr:aquaglyceroporin like protein [Exophiala viscosa]
MSQTRSRDHQPNRQTSATRVQSSPYSLAGPPPSQLGRFTTGTSSHDGSSVATRRHRNSSTRDERSSSDKPIWGLAAPFPRVRRARMDRRSTNQQREASADTNRTLRESTSEVSRQPSGPVGTQPAPQVEVTPDRHEEPRQPQDGGKEAAARRGDILRRATTAHPSTLHEGLDKYSTLRPEDAVSERESRRSQELAAEHISAQDQAASEKTPSQTTRPSNALGADLQRLPSRSTGQAAARKKTENSADGRQPSLTIESEVDRARRLLQSYADTAEPELGPHDDPQNIDWEDINETHDEKHESTDEAEHKEPEDFNAWGRFRRKIRKPFAEFLGTVVFMTIGLCASVVRTAAADDYGNLLTAYLAWGIGVMIGIYIAGGVSGGHLNPAISIMLSVYRGFPWSQCWKFIVAQLLGSIAASGIVYGLYKDTIEEYQASKAEKLGPAFWTQPRTGLSNASAFFTEFTATAIASGSVLALGDSDNSPPGAGMSAFIVGLLIIALQMAFSYNTGTALNPARDLGPRLITLAAGFGSEVFTMKGAWWVWGPWLGTITGALFGALCYDAFVFIGGESPVNYPTGEVGARIRSWGETRNLSNMGRGKQDQDENAKRIAEAV